MAPYKRHAGITGPGATFFTLSLLLAGCLTPAEDATLQTDAETPEIVVDPARPVEKYGEIVTGPAVGPDFNATTAAPPRLVEGEWWRIRFDADVDGVPVEVVRVVADANPGGYVMGMPHEGWLKEAIAFHSPAFGDVGFDLSYNTHNQAFEPVRFPLTSGATWDTSFALTPYVATVEAADQYTATIHFSPKQDPQPTDPLTNALGLTGQDPGMRLVYDARMHEIVHMESFVGSWDVVEHGYDFEGWVTVPRGEHTAIDYGTFGPAMPGEPLLTRTVKVDGGFNRMTMMHLLFALSPGSYRIKSVTPDKAEFVTEATGAINFVLRFYEARDPDGTWTQEDVAAGAGGTYSMGIAYHQYDIRLPDGQRRSDHSHSVIR